MNQILCYIKQHQSSTKRLIGINYDDLNQLISKAQDYEEKKQQEMAKKETRLIKAGSGRKSKLNKEEQIILTLYYLHNFPTFQILGINFNVSESTAHRLFHYWLNILQSCQVAY